MTDAAQAARCPRVTIRPYRSADRPAVRHICFATGHAGSPVAAQWADQESFADMFTGYHTDREPESAFVAEIDGSVAGYLLGCRNSPDAWSPIRVAAGHVLGRGIAFRRGTAGFVWRAVADVVRDRIRHGTGPSDLVFDDPAYPAHLHIDLLPRARGIGVGTRLMGTWFDLLAREQIPGCHLQTMTENHAAVAFFRAVGFVPYGPPVLSPGQRAPRGGRAHVTTMVRPVA